MIFENGTSRAWVRCPLRKYFGQYCFSRAERIFANRICQGSAQSRGTSSRMPQRDFTSTMMDIPVLLLSQCIYRINLRRLPSWKNTSDESDGNHKRRNSEECHRVNRRDAINEAGHRQDEHGKERRLYDRTVVNRTIAIRLRFGYA